MRSGSEPRSIIRHRLVEGSFVKDEKIARLADHIDSGWRRIKVEAFSQEDLAREHEAHLQARAQANPTPDKASDQSP